MKYPFARVAGMITNERERERFARCFNSNHDNVFENLRRWAEHLGKGIVFGE